MTVNCTELNLTNVMRYQSPPSIILVGVVSLCSLSLGFLLNAWILLVSWGPTRVPGAFKYPVCNLAFWDILLCLMQLYQTARILSGFRLVSGVVAANIWLCRLRSFLFVGGGFGMLGGLLHAPTQRLLVFYDQLPFADYALERRPNICFSLLLATVYLLPIISALFGPTSGCLNTICGNLPVMKGGLTVLYVIALTGYVIACVQLSFVVGKMKQMWKLTVSIQDKKRLQENREILMVSIIQTVSPVVLTTPTIVYAVFFGIRNIVDRDAAQALMTAVFYSNPMFDALVTIRSIKVYRKLAMGLFCRKPAETGTIQLNVMPRTNANT